ncbi:MAG: carbohydrate ABC transporter permease [Clostridiales bacterium]|nr:carbohydrate ABC transporter permease [Clostridiales bacterium]
MVREEARSEVSRKKKKRKYFREGNRYATILMYVIAVLIIFVTIYPMYYVLILSLSEPTAAATMHVYVIPKGFSLQAYNILIKDMELWRAYRNTILYVSATTVLMLITCVLVAYPLTCKELVGRKYLNMFLLIPMYFGGGMIPTFLLILRLGLYDSPLSQIIPCCFSIWYIILVKSYFSSIPEELRDAAKIDGAGIWMVLFRIYIPMSKAILAVIAVYTIVSVWNSWYGAMLYLPHTEWQPLQLYLRRVLVEMTRTVSQMSVEQAKEQAMRALSNAQMKYAMIIFTTLPVLCVYPFLQKYFVKGVMLGSLKE